MFMNRKKIAAAALALSTVFGASAFAEVDPDQYGDKPAGPDAKSAIVLDVFAADSLETAARHLPQIMKNAQSAEPYARAISAETLADLALEFPQEYADISFGQLVTMLVDTDPGVQAEAVAGIGKIGRADPDFAQAAVTATLRLAQDQNAAPSVRNTAVHAAGFAAVADAPAADALLKALPGILANDPDATVRLAAAWASYNVINYMPLAHAQKAVDVLGPHVRDPDPKIANAAAVYLGQACWENRKLSCPQMP